MGLISTQLTANTALEANGLIPVGEVLHKNCSRISASGTTWAIRGSGYYLATAFVTIAPTVAGEVILTLNVNGSPVATGTATTSAVNEDITIPIHYVGLNECGCATDRLTITTSVAGTVTESDVVIERM